MATFLVSSTADDGSAGTLRWAIQQANAAGGDDVIVFDASLDGETIVLASDLPQIAGDAVIDGGALDLTISGAGQHRVFWASSGDITLQSLTITNGAAEGGRGGDAIAGAGGGGAGMGGALFVDSAANVTLRNVSLADSRAEGGRGGVAVGGGSATGGGGGGLDEDAEDGWISGPGAGGGPAGGSTGSHSHGGNGGAFSGGGGGGVDFGPLAFGLPAIAYNGGHGGFGGGGAGGGDRSDTSTPGQGGYGGGGGGGGAGAGVGGYGGGDGAYNDSQGGGGAGLGGAVFVREGAQLTLENVSFSGNSVAGGIGHENGSAEGANLFLMDGGALSYSVSAGQTRTLAGGVEGDAAIHLSKTGAGVLVLAAGAASDFGSLTVLSGALQVDAALGAATTVSSGAVLQGAGTVGAVTVQSGGTLAPGASPGVLSTGNLALQSGAIFEVELGGTGAGQFDRVNVTGSVSLGGATLDIVLFGGFTPTAGNSFLLLDNDSADAVTGAFTGFVDDVPVLIGGLRYTVDYQGGDGNDVVLIVSAGPPPPPPPRVIPTTGGSGNDLAILDDNGTSYSAGEGDDLVMADGGNDSLHGNPGNDTLHGGAGDDIVHGGQGGDVLYGGDGADLLFGDKGDDFVHGGQGDDVIDGGDGSDALAGGQGKDVLRGGDGADMLSGDRGNDTLMGGPGADVFRFSAGGGADVVLDFNAAEGDRLQVLGSYTLSQVGAHAVVDLGSGDTITLQNVQLAQLPAGWMFG